MALTNNIVTLLSNVEFPPTLQEKLVTILYGLSGNFCKSYVLVKYFLLFYFAFVQFILLCLFHFPNVTLYLKIKTSEIFCFGLHHLTS